MSSSLHPYIILWRIAKDTRDFTSTDLTGGGAAITGGRWNSEGNHVVYASTSISLCTLETLAHLGDDIACRNRFLVSIEIPGNLWKNREIRTPKQLPPTWVAEPPGLGSTQVGDAWLKAGNGLLLLVPSVIVPEEFNVLINPKHKGAELIKAKVVRQYIYDFRLGTP